MGCRPSRRAVASVRVAGDGPWDIGRRSSRPRLSTGDSGVRLRPRSSSRRRSRDGGRQEGGGGGNPRDRYSAPPTDRQFPPHSCTSATYEHGCCGTSRITLRLSKNGSTLEIEKCDFQHSVKACDQCGPRETVNPAAPLQLDMPLRTQSAPNLQIKTCDGNSSSSGHNPPHKGRLVVDSETYTLPQSSYCMENGSQKTSGCTRKDSLSMSIQTATKIEVDVERTGSSYPSSVCNSFYENTDSSARKDKAADCMCSDQERQCRNAQNDFNIFQHGPLADPSLVSSDNQSGHDRKFAYSHDQNRLDCNLSSGREEKLLISTCVKNQALTSEVTDRRNFHTVLFDDDLECETQQKVLILKSYQDEIHNVSCSSGHGRGQLTNSSSNTDCRDNACGAARHFNEQDNNGNSMVTMDGSVECMSMGNVTTGATDYRIRVLRAQPSELSHMSNTTVSSPCVMTSTNLGNQCIPSAVSHTGMSHAQHTFTNDNSREEREDVLNFHDHVLSPSGSGRADFSKNRAASLINCRDRPMAMSCKDMIGILSKLGTDDEESSDQKFVSVSSRMQEHGHPEMTPYIHEDFNGELSSG